MEIRRISDLFWNIFPNMFFMSIILFVITGACFSLLIPFIIYAIGSDMSGINRLDIDNYSYFNSPTSELAVFFLAACIAIVVVKASSMIFSVYIAKKAAVSSRISLYDRIYNMSYSDLESIGHSKLINIINVDILNVTMAATILPTLWGNFVTIVGVLAYLIYIDYQVFYFVLVSLFFAILTYQLPMYFATRYFMKSRDDFDNVQKGVEALIRGSKELKLNKEKFLEFKSKALLIPENRGFREAMKGYVIFALAENYGAIICFLVIGIVVFHMPYVYEISHPNLLGVVMALLYITGPVGIILNSLGTVRQGQVSLSKIRSFYGDLKSEKNTGEQKVNKNFSAYRVKNLRYRYSGEGDFSISPINLTFNKGEISFIVGGNGSGKSTLSKCLSLHYHPTEGELLLDNEVITFGNIQSARECISAIYSDYYLFEKLYGIKDADEHLFSKYLSYLELDGKVTIHEKTLNTTSLSDGQRRRLALLTLLLENRDICIFDEWAADQDPRFKEVFYRKILLDLKRKNKIVIVISHDDSYFDCADNIVYMESGMVKNVVKNNCPLTSLVSVL